MRIEERKLISISRAIGLFMIFEGMFRRNILEGVKFEESTSHLFLSISANGSIYLLIITGILLCITRNLIFFYLTYFTCIFSLFGIVFEILPGAEVNILWCIALGLAHLLVMIAMIWTHIQIKTNIINPEKEIKKA